MIKNLEKDKKSINILLFQMQKVRQRFHSDGFTFLGFTYVVSEFESLPVFMVFNGSLIEILRPTIKLNQLLFLLQQPFNRMN